MKQNMEKKRTDTMERWLHRYGEIWTESSDVDWEDLTQRFEARLEKQVTRHRRFASLFGWMSQPGWAWAAAAACLLAFFLAPAYWNRSVGQMVFVSGEVLLNGTPLSKCDLSLGSGDVLNLDRGGEAMVSLDGGRVDLFLREGSRLAFDSSDTVSLAKGDIWVRVDTDSGFFGIETPHGTVQVHGTTFGVYVGEKETRVDIAAGEVSVRTDAGTEFIRPGKEAILAGRNLPPRVVASPEDVTPGWARETFERAATARELRYFPSVEPR